MLKNLSIGFLLLLLLSSCAEKTPKVNLEQNPFKVFPAHFTQKVMVENFVSESLTATVENSFVISDLESKYQERLIVANLHKSDWLETPYTYELSTMLGGLNSYPRAAINRHVGVNTIDNDDNFTLLKPINWDYTIARALQEEAQVGLAIETAVLPNHTGSIILHVAHKDSIAGDIRVGLYMIEDPIAAIFQVGTDGNFIHHHVMKSSLLDVEGDSINLSNVDSEGEIVSKEYLNIDLSLYHVENLHVIAFVFKYDKDFRKLKILNAVKVKFGGIKFWNE